MEYALVCLIKGEPGEYHQDLVKEIHDKFDVFFLYNEKIPAHFTLKDTFETEDIMVVENLVESFCMKHKPTDVKLEGFNHFADNVVYLDVHLSSEAKSVFNDLVKELRWIQQGPYDGHDKKLHATLACRDIKNKFKEIWEYLKQKKPSFDYSFDNITILKREKNRWVVHKEYRMD